MIEASIRTLTPRPRASILTTTFVESRKARKTLVMMSAAQLMTRPVAASPVATVSGPLAPGPNARLIAS